MRDADQLSDEELIERGRAAVEVRERQEWRRFGMRRLLDDKLKEDPDFDVEAYGRGYRKDDKDDDKRKESDD